MAMPHILVVDDEPLGLAYLQRVLSAEGWEVEGASSGEQAVETYRGRDFDLVLTDYRLPGRDGLQVLEDIRAIRAEVRVILFSAFLDDDLDREARRQGVDRLLSKPFHRKELIATVQEALAEASPAAKWSLHFGMVGENETMHTLYQNIPRVAESDTTVLITGASGTGKELVAQAIHSQSRRRGKPLVALNCGAIPEGLMESELFGHLRGAFTGAVLDHAGRVEQADGGTLFLDEIGDLSLTLQVKILRLLQEREYYPVGSAQSRKANVRIVAATNRNLEELVAAGRFREDLFYRLNVVPLHVPAMREKPADILLLAQYFLEKLNRLHHSRLEGFSPEALACLQGYPWPGNVRELENLIARLAILKGEGEIRKADLPAALQSPALHALGLQTAALPTAGAINFREEVDRFEHQLLLQALQQSNWNKNKAAELLKINRTTLVEKLKRKKISRPVAAPTLPFPPPRLVKPSSNS